MFRVLGIYNFAKLSGPSWLLGRQGFQQRDEMFADKNASLISYIEIAKKFPMRKWWEKHSCLFLTWPQYDLIGICTQKFYDSTIEPT